MNRFLNFRLTLFIGALFVIGTVAFLTITSCEKEKSSTFSGQETNANTPLTPSCENPCSDCGDDACTPKTVLEAVSDTGDLENHKVNMILYHYAQAVREAAKDATLRQYMLNAMTVNNQGVSVSLYTLAQGNTTFASFINAKLRQSMSETNIYPRGVEVGVEALIASTTWNANAYLKDRLIYSGTPYDPVIYYKTKPVAAAGAYPVTVLISQEVNDCDDAAGWRGDVPGLVGETEGRNGNRVVMIVGPGLDGNVNARGNDIANALETAKDRTSRVDMMSIRIKGAEFRYERSGKSEITGAYIKFSPVLESNESNFYLKICKKDIEDKKVVLNNNTLIQDGAWDLGSHYEGFYEFDWSAQYWTMPAPCTTEKIKTQRKYAHEWYNVDFCGAASTYFPSLSGGTATRDNTKSTFVLTGIQ